MLLLRSAIIRDSIIQKRNHIFFVPSFINIPPPCFVIFCIQNQSILCGSGGVTVLRHTLFSNGRVVKSVAANPLAAAAALYMNMFNLNNAL